MQNKKKRNGYLKRYLALQIKHKGVIILLGLVFLIGVIVGCSLSSGDSSIIALLEKLLLNSQRTRRKNEYEFFKSVLYTFATNGAVLLLLFFCGFCSISQPLVVAAVLFKGLGFGLLGGFLYGSGEKSSLIYYAIVLLPEMLFSIILIIVAAKEAISFSKGFLEILLSVNHGASGEWKSTTLQAYCARFIFLSLLNGAISVFIGFIKTIYFLL